MTIENATALHILMDDDLYLTQADLHQESFAVVSPEPEIAVSETPSTRQIEFLGGNLQHFLIITAEPMPDNHLKALESTLGRKQLNLEDVAIIDFSAQEILTFEELYASFMPQKLVLFGVNPAEIQLPKTDLNQLITFAECQVLYTFSFGEMLGNKEKTKAFWEPMKNL